MNNHLMSPGKLLDKNGNIREPGYAFDLNQEYSRKDIKARKSRIKEWDYYYFGDDEYGIAVTLDDNGYMGLASSSILDFKNKTYINKAYMYWFCMGKVGMPSTSVTGSVSKAGKNYSVNMINNNGERRIVIDMKNYKNKKDLHVDATLTLTTDKSMVIATPFNKPKHFYYNQKINLLKVEGSFKFGDLEHKFKDGSYGVLDWGRGVWTYKNTWYWSSMSGECDGHRIGFNLGYGFGNTSAASENMLFVDEKAFKLDDVRFEIPQNSKGKDDFIKPWKFTSEKGDIDMIFTPILDRADCTNAGIICQNAHQVFGKFNGRITVEGKTYKIENLIGFAEKVSNRW